MKDRVLLFTGGLDSACAAALFGKPPLLYVLLRGRMAALGKDTDDYRTIRKVKEVLGYGEIDWIEAPWPVPPREDGHIPLRNLHLASAGALLANEVILGAVKGESSPDKSDKFLRATSKALTAASQGRQIKVIAPLKKYTKRQLIPHLFEAVGKEKGLEIISLTRSCYSSEHERCGECMACFRRWVALSLNGIQETHHRPPWEWKPPGWESRFEYLRDAPIREWPGIAQINAEALLALRLAS